MDVLDKVLKLQPEVELKVDELEVKKMLEAGERKKTHTTHFKMVQTKVTEVDHVESSDDELTEQKQSVTKANKNKGCFGRCFKKKAK